MLSFAHVVVVSCRVVAAVNMKLKVSEVILTRTRDAAGGQDETRGKWVEVDGKKSRVRRVALRH